MGTLHRAEQARPSGEIMTFKGAYFTVVVLTHVGFAALFLFLHLHRRSKFLSYIALAWLIEALRVFLPAARGRGIPFSDRWFALQDIGYLIVTWLLMSAAASFVCRRGFPRLLPLLYFGLSLPALLVNHVFFRPYFLHPNLTPSQAELFLPILVNDLVLFLPGGVARLIATAWIFGSWKRTRLPGALVLAVFFLLHALGSLSVPLRWYFSYDPPDLYLTWFIEVIGISVGVVMVAMHEQQAARVAAEQKYQLFFDRMADAALLFDRNEICVDANPIARDKLGLVGGQAFHLRDLFTEQAPYEAFLRVAAAAATPKLESSLKTLDGHIFPANISGAVHRDGGSEPRGFFLTFEDISARKRIEQKRLELLAKERALAAEKALQESQAELARVTRALTLGEMAASIAHEVNQPLAALVINAEACVRWLAGQTPNLHEAQEALGRIVADGNRASEVIRRIRGFLKKEEKRMSQVDLNETVREAVAFARAELLKRHVGIQFELAAQLPTVVGDRIQLQQVILNLVLNGGEAMTSPGKLLVTSSRASDNRVLVAVRDFGAGINAADMKRLFDPFFTTKPGGMGMGLLISRSIIEAHGGRIWAEPNQGPGMTFQFSLPAGGGFDFDR